MNDLEFIKLGSVASIKGGTGFPERYQGGKTGIPFIKVSDMNSSGNERFITNANNYVLPALASRLHANLFSENSIVFAKVGAALLLNRRRLLTQSTIIDNNMMAVTPIDIDPDFLFQVLLTVDFGLFVQPGAVPSVNQSQVSNIPLPNFSLDEQRRIAAILSALDEQIEKTDALIEKLLLQRTGVVQQSLLPLAEEAEDFDLGTLASLVTSGSRGWGKYYSECGALFLRIGNLTREHPNLKLNDIARVAVPVGGEGERTRIQEGDLLISITADLGVIGCIPSGFEEAYVNQHIALVRIESEKVHPRWVAHVLGSPYGTEQFLALNATGAKAGLTLPSVRRLRVPCPTLNKQQELVDILDSMDLAVEAERRYLKKLRLQKAGLMLDLLTGRVRASQ